MVTLIKLLLWGGLLAVGFSLVVLALALASRMSRLRGAPQRPFALAAKLWPQALGVLVLACVILIAGLAASSETLVANLSPASCSVESGQAPSQPPKALATADDYLAQGAYDFDRGSCAAANADFSRAIELNPNLAEAYNSRAYTYMIQHQYALALPDLDRAIELRPNYLNALMNRGDIYNYYYSINYDRALADYDRALRLPGAEHTSACGHRLLAANRGWNPNVFVDILTAFGVGSESACGEPSPAL